MKEPCEGCSWKATWLVRNLRKVGFTKTFPAGYREDGQPELLKKAN
jgi:hypothetical protein